MAFLKRYADPQKAVKYGRRRLEKFWDKHSRGQAGKERAGKVYEACCKADELYRQLRQRGRLPFDYEAVQEEIVLQRARKLKQRKRAPVILGLTEH